MSDEKETWEWTPEREKTLEMLLGGFSKASIAKEVGVHRNTVSNWCSHPEFVKRFHELQEDHDRETRQRRERETTRFANKVATLADRALTQAEAKPDDRHAVAVARDWLEEFRELREQERKDRGDDVQQHHHTVKGAVIHAHGSIKGMSFKEFATKQLESKVIDVEAIEDEADPLLLMTQLATQALTGDSTLEEMASEDQKAQEAMERSRR